MAKYKVALKMLLRKERVAKEGNRPKCVHVHYYV